MKIPMPEELGLPQGAGNFEVTYVPNHELLLLSCIAPLSTDPEILVGRVYARRPRERVYSLVGSAEALESWTSPTPWEDGILVVCGHVSRSLNGEVTVNTFVDLKLVDFSSASAKSIWAPADRSIWIVDILRPGPGGHDIYRRLG